MTTPLNSNSIDSEGNLLVPLHGIRIAMALVLLPAGAYWLFGFLGDREWHEHHPGTGASGVPDPLWMVILWVALLFVPFSISGLLLSRRSEEYKTVGAGLAAGLFACGLVFAILAFLSEFLQFFPDPYFWENLIAILTFFVCSAWIVISAFRIAAKAGWGLFLLAGAATLVCLTWGGHSLNNAEIRFDRENEVRKARAAVMAEWNSGEAVS